VRSGLIENTVDRVVRKGYKLHTEGLEGNDLNSETDYDVLETGFKWWTTELRRAEHVFKSYRDGYREIGLKRPTLPVRDILVDLESLTCD